ncbi:MAG: hypothetical protein M3462_02925, partial [Chloroflexota bacterium]|nr:hypothetical protein [Chloroflexota bacterium]
METRTRDGQSDETRDSGLGTTDHAGDLAHRAGTDTGTGTGTGPAAPGSGIPPHWADRADLARRATDRRRLLGGAFGAGLAVTLAAGLVRAQDAGTPAADDATGDSGATDDTGTATADLTTDERGQALIDRASLALETVQADLNSVAGQADTDSAGDTVAEGTALRDTAQAALDGGETARAIRAAGASLAMTRAANCLLRANLSFTGLPSQEARSSRVLAATFETIERVGLALTEAGVATTPAAGTPAATHTAPTSAGDGSVDLVEADRFAGRARGAYGEAFDLYAAGAY